jgi:homoserine acetyltransferase
MGARQPYEWAVRYPAMIRRGAQITGAAGTALDEFLSLRHSTDAGTS